MITAAELDGMLAAGMTAEQVLQVVRVQLQQAEARAAVVREQTKDRVTRYRERQRNERNERNALHALHRVTPSETIVSIEDFKASVDVTENNASLSLTSSFEDSLEGKKERVVVARARGGDASRDRGTRLPDEWSPRPEDFDFAVSTLGESGCKRELAKFRDWWPAQPGVKGRKVDWDRTWRTWVRKEDEKRKGNGHGKKSVQDIAREFHEAALEGRLVAGVERWRRGPPDRSVDSGASAPDVRLLPKG